jgi:DNA-binding NarL/FixJ family response regulator
VTARVVVVDDQTVVREGLVLILGMLPDIEVVGSAVDGEQALLLVAAQRPDVVLMDLRMPRLDGVAATRRIRAEFPETHVVVLSTYSDDDSVFAALRAGARGYLTKDAPSATLAEAIATVCRGDAHFDPGVQRRLVEAVRPATSSASSAPTTLTPRETDVLRLIAAGQSNVEIAQRLYITQATVKTHINNLFAKTGVRDRAQAVTYAFRHGLVSTKD